MSENLKETIKDVFVIEGSPDTKYILEIQVIYTSKSKKKNEILQYSASEKIMSFNREALDEIVKQTFLESGFLGEHVVGFTYKVLEA